MFTYYTIDLTYQRGFAVLSNPCHDQNYDRSVLYPAESGSKGCSLKMCADEVNDDEEDELW